MIHGLYHSAAGMMVNEYKQDVLANNIANSDSVGFKRQFAVFAEREPASRAGRRDGASNDLFAGATGGTWLGRTHTDHSDGPTRLTGEPLDVAIKGQGFFAVQGQGETLFSRDGRFMRDARGQLIRAADGAAVLGAGNAPIFTNPGGGAPHIDPDGRVWQDGASVGRLSLTDFENYAGLEPAGHGRYRPVGTAARPAAAELEGGALEDSGVESVREMVSMIEVARAYQLNAQMISLQDQTVGRLLAAVPRA